MDETPKLLCNLEELEQKLKNDNQTLNLKVRNFIWLLAQWLPSDLNLQLKSENGKSVEMCEIESIVVFIDEESVIISDSTKGESYVYFDEHSDNAMNCVMKLFT